jgi:hypothetical protein
LWFFYKVFNEYWQNNLFLFLLIGHGKTIFIAPLVLLYFQSYRKKITFRYAITHLIIPIIFFVSIAVIRFLLADNNENPDKYYNLFLLILSLTFLFYFILTQKELRVKAKNTLFLELTER